MNILFVENRYKTYFWEALAECLAKDGFKITWIVQNVMFTPKVGKVFKIEYPRKTDLRPPPENHQLNYVKSTDRFINYFKGHDKHYAYYWGKIGNILKEVKPDLIIGESTLFHELMTIAWCKKLRIPYIHPTSPGYPPGRFTIYGYDTKIPIWRNKENPSDSICEKLLHDITMNKVRPDYMRKYGALNTTNKFPAPGSLADKMSILKGYIAGEKYNTPNPLIKMSLQYTLKKRIQKWQKLVDSKNQQITGNKIILYPLQMQPEANIDVWGNEYRNQAELIQQIASSLPNNWILAVKINPKAKYELSDSLIRIIQNNKNVIALPIGLAMREIFKKLSLLITVTGTVAIEAVMLGVPVVSLGHTLASKYNGCVKISSPSEVTRIIKMVDNQEFLLANENQRLNLIKDMYLYSFPGIVSDPCHMPNVLEHQNIENVVMVLRYIAGSLSNRNVDGSFVREILPEV